MCNEPNLTPKVQLEIPQHILDEATKLRGHNPLQWLQIVLDETSDAREPTSQPTTDEPSGFADLTRRQVAIATLVDKVIEGLVDLIMFQAQYPVTADIIPLPDENADPKTDIIGLES